MKCTATDATYWWSCVQFRWTVSPESRVCNLISLQPTLLEVMTRYDVQLNMYPHLIRFVKMTEAA